MAVLVDNIRVEEPVYKLTLCSAPPFLLNVHLQGPAMAPKVQIPMFSFALCHSNSKFWCVVNDPYG
eukprot:9051997-Prorocentrum_lima.AAC.1